MTAAEIRAMKDRIKLGSPQEELRLEIAIEQTAQLAELNEKFVDFFATQAEEIQAEEIQEGI